MHTIDSYSFCCGHPEFSRIPDNMDMYSLHGCARDRSVLLLQLGIKGLSTGSCYCSGIESPPHVQSPRITIQSTGSHLRSTRIRCRTKRHGLSQVLRFPQSDGNRRRPFSAPLVVKAKNTEKCTSLRARGRDEK